MDDQREKGENDISRSFCVACLRDLADQPRLYFLLSPWTHFLALGVGQRKKQQPREGETERKRGWREGGAQQLDSDLKLELIPSALFNTTLFLFSLRLFPSGPLWRDTLQAVALICQTVLSFEDVSNKCIHRSTLRLQSKPIHFKSWICWQHTSAISPFWTMSLM